MNNSTVELMQEINNKYYHIGNRVIEKNTAHFIIVFCNFLFVIFLITMYLIMKPEVDLFINKIKNIELR